MIDEMKVEDRMSIRQMIQNRSLIGDRYQILGEIGHHKTARLYQYRGIDVDTNQEVVVKFEPEKYAHSTLASDYKIYEYLREKGLEVGVPEIKYFGNILGYNVVVAEILGSSLQKYSMILRRKFSLKTVCMLADQMITRIEYIHKGHLIHKNISPMNFFMGLGDTRDILFLNNYGISKEFEPIVSSGCSGSRRVHISYNEEQIFLGNPVFGSLRALEGVEMRFNSFIYSKIISISRRDDIEAIGWCLVSFLKDLPWNSYTIRARKTDRKESLDEIVEKRKNLNLEDVCEDLPIEFLVYLEYSSTMGFQQEPDYTFLRNLFRNLMKSRNYVNDKIFDWTHEYLDSRYYTDSDDDHYISSRRSRRRRSRRDSYDRPRSRSTEIDSSSLDGSRESEDREGEITSPMSKESGEIIERGERPNKNTSIVRENDSNRKRKIEMSCKIRSNGETKKPVQNNNPEKSRNSNKEINKSNEKKSSNAQGSKKGSKNAKTNCTDSKNETETRRAAPIKDNLVNKNEVPGSSQNIVVQEKLKQVEQIKNLNNSIESVDSKSREGINTNASNNSKGDINEEKEISTTSNSVQDKGNKKNDSISEIGQKFVGPTHEQVKNSNVSIENANLKNSDTNPINSSKQNDDDSKNEEQEKPTSYFGQYLGHKKSDSIIPESDINIVEQEMFENSNIETFNSKRLEDSNSLNSSKQNDSDDKNEDMDKEKPTASIVQDQICENEKAEDIEKSPADIATSLLPNIYDSLNIPWLNSDSD